MTQSFIYKTDPALLVSLLFIGMLIALYLGRLLSKKLDRSPDETQSQIKSTVVASILALFGFLLAFTFGLSGSRFDDRRKSVVEEANCIGTAVLRAELYPDTVKDEFKTLFKQYLAARLAFYESGIDESLIKISIAKAGICSSQLWKKATALSTDKNLFIASSQMIPALNAMFDIATYRNISREETVPNSIVFFLLMISLISAFYIGYLSNHEKKLDKTVIVGFCLLVSLVIYITLDLDKPRKGLINLDISYQSMYELKKMFE
jgi:hypothetical protein